LKTGVNYLKDEVDDSLPWKDQERIRRRRWQAYVRHLEKLKDRISKPAFHFFAYGFCDDSLHDGRMLSFSAGDGLDYVPDGSTPFLHPRAQPGRPKSGVQIRILNCQEDALYTFRYKGVRRIVCQKSPHPHFANADDFDCLDVYALTESDKHFLRHEYRFSSGASILIEFQRLIFRRQPIQRRYSITY